MAGADALAGAQAELGAYCEARGCCRFEPKHESRFAISRRNKQDNWPGCQPKNDTRGNWPKETWPKTNSRSLHVSLSAPSTSPLHVSPSLPASLSLSLSRPATPRARAHARTHARKCPAPTRSSAPTGTFFLLTVPVAGSTQWVRCRASATVSSSQACEHSSMERRKGSEHGRQKAGQRGRCVIGRRGAETKRERREMIEGRKEESREEGGEE